VETLVTDHTRLQSVTRILSFSLQLERFTMAESPSSPAFGADSPYLPSPGGSPAVRPVRGAAAKAKLAFPGSNSSKKARRSSSDSIEAPTTLASADLATTRLYIRDLKDRLIGAGSISEDLSIRVLLFYAKLKEKFLARCVKDRLEARTYGAKIREQVLFAFSLSKTSYQKILSRFATADEAYETKRVGNCISKPTRIPRTRSVLTAVREFVRDRRSRRERVTGKQVLEFMVEKEIIIIPRDRMGFFERKAYATAVRAVNLWLEKNGYQRGFCGQPRQDLHSLSSSPTGVPRSLLGRIVLP
jgi:hypothetical protein